MQHQAPGLGPLDVLEIETARTLSDAIWTETCAWAVGSCSVKGCSWMAGLMVA